MTQLDEKDLKVIRLDNGEILFSKVLVTDKSKDNGYLELHWPMKVLVKHDDETRQTQLALLKWLPFTDTTSVPLAARCIMSVSNLGEEYKLVTIKSKYPVFVISKAATKEFKDPIIYSSHPDVSAMANRYQLSGSAHDHENNFRKSAPLDRIQKIIFYSYV